MICIAQILFIFFSSLSGVYVQVKCTTGISILRAILPVCTNIHCLPLWCSVIGTKYQTGSRNQLKTIITPVSMLLSYQNEVRCYIQVANYTPCYGLFVKVICCKLFTLVNVVNILGCLRINLAKLRWHPMFSLFCVKGYKACILYHPRLVGPWTILFKIGYNGSWLPGVTTASIQP